MDRDSVLTTLAGVMAGDSRPQLESLAVEMQGAGVLSSGRQWASSDGALLYLRWLAHHVPLEDFLADIAWAPLAGVTVHEHCSTWRAEHEHARKTPFAQMWGCDCSALDVLTAHLESVAAGCGSFAAYPRLDYVALYEGEAGRYVDIAMTFSPPAVPSPVFALLAYGDHESWADFSATASRALGGVLLSGLVPELRRDHAPGREQPHINAVAAPAAFNPPELWENNANPNIAVSRTLH